MVAPAYLNFGARTSQSSGTSAAPALPSSRTNGNILIAIVGSKNNSTHGISGTGWVSLDVQVNSGASWTSSMWWRRVDGTEAAPTISWATSSANFAQIVQYSRADIDPSESAADIFGTIVSNTGSGTPHTNAGFNATAANSGAFYMGTSPTNTAYGAPGGSWTENIDNGSATGTTRNGGGERVLVNMGDASGALSLTAGGGAWILWQIEIKEPQAPGGYTLDAGTGTFALNGSAVSLKASRTIGTATGAFALTGFSVGLYRGRRIAADAASFALAGQSLVLRASRTIGAATGAFALNGQSVNFGSVRVLNAETGVFSIVGSALEFRVARSFNVGSGVFIIAGEPIGMRIARRLIVESGSFGLVGLPVQFGVGAEAFEIDADRLVTFRGSVRLVEFSGTVRSVSFSARKRTVIL